MKVREREKDKDASKCEEKRLGVDSGCQISPIVLCYAVDVFLMTKACCGVFDEAHEA